MPLNRLSTIAGRVAIASFVLLLALTTISHAQSIPEGGTLKRLAQPQARGFQPSKDIDWELVDRIYAAICRASIREPKIVMAQAILETGWFRSSSLMNLNNLFGFRQVNYLKFDQIEDSIDYYKTWQDTYLTDPEADYLGFLDRIKYGAPGYSHHVKRISWTKDCP